MHTHHLTHGARRTYGFFLEDRLYYTVRNSPIAWSVDLSVEGEGEITTMSLYAMRELWDHHNGDSRLKEAYPVQQDNAITWMTRDNYLAHIRNKQENEPSTPF